MATVMKGFKRLGLKNVEQAWGSSPQHLAVAEWSGMNALDIETLSVFCVRRMLLMIIRAPGGMGREIIGIGLPIYPKPKHIDEKTGGKWIKQGNMYYCSDFDLLSVWSMSDGGYRKFTLAYLTRQTTEFLSEVNKELLWPIQHGANDDYLDESGNPKNRNIGEKFVSIDQTGFVAKHYSKAEMKDFYAKKGLAPWLYD